MLAKEEAFIARFKARASHAAQVQSRVKKLEKIESVEPPRRRKVVAFDFPQPPRSGDDVAKLERRQQGLGHAHASTTDFDFLIRRRERWCVMGVNGAGKSTLLKLIAGAAQPDAGKVTLGASVKLGYFAQHAMDLLDGDQTVIETLVKAVHARASIGSLRTLLGAFGFSGDDVDKRCRVLSGGEKARVVLAQHALRSAELPGARRADQPPRPRHQGDADAGARRLRGHDAVRLARSPLPQRGLEPRARADGRGRAHATAAATPSTSPRAATRPRCALGEGFRLPQRSPLKVGAT